MSTHVAQQQARGATRSFGRILALCYGVVSYLVFFATFLYTVGFVANIVVPKSIDTGAPTTLGRALLVDLLLLSLFAIQHSGMARPGFKRWWTRLVPKVIERSTYVLLASSALIVLLWQWQPLPATVWQVNGTIGVALLYALSGLGWLTVFFATFLINHFDLFGLRQVYRNLRGQAHVEPGFRTPLLYKLIRHPIMLGFIIAFWATPHMTVGHLLFAAGTTAYILVAVQLEERDLVNTFGDTYREYRKHTRMFIPWPKR